MSEQRTRDPGKQYRRALLWGLALSVVAHALTFLVFNDTALPPSPFAAAGERQGEMRAALGGGMDAVELRSPPEAAPSPPEEVVDPDPVEEAVEPPEPEIDDVALPSVALGDLISLPGPPGPLDQPGRLDGREGAGDGGTEAEGRFRVLPPRPRGMTLPPGDRPNRVRGQEVEVEVWVFVTATGSVVADSTRLNPPTGDRRFDRRLREHAAGWRFEPARRDGEPVAEWFRYTITM